MGVKRFALIGLGITIVTALSAVVIGREREQPRTGMPAPGAVAGGQAAPGVTVVASRLDWPGVAALVGASDVIAIVTWSGDREVAVSLPAVDGSAKDSRVSVLRSFETIEVLKGRDVPAHFEAALGRTNVFAPRPNIPGGFVLEQEVVRLDTNQRYVVFLARQTGESDAQLLFRGEPNIAHIDGDRLKWVVTSDYVENRRRAGLSVGVDGAAADFDGQTLSSLRSMIGGR